jgi:hypothetical protein
LTAGRLGLAALGRNDREQSIAQELQHFAAVVGHRIANAFEMLIEPTHDFGGRRAIDERGEASEIGERKRR